MKPMEEQLQLRIHGEASLPTLIYLPGLHGDWTLVGGFLRALDGRVRFVEITYPRTLEWSLDDYAAAIEAALAKNGIKSGWLLGESFGSQPLWALVGRNSGTGVSPVCFKENGGMNSQAGRLCHFQIEGVILAGGFVKHPMRQAVRLAQTQLAQLAANHAARLDALAGEGVIPRGSPGPPPNPPPGPPRIMSGKMVRTDVLDVIWLT